VFSTLDSMSQHDNDDDDTVGFLLPFFSLSLCVSVKNLFQLVAVCKNMMMMVGGGELGRIAHVTLSLAKTPSRVSLFLQD
jgi:hypothetical protein